MHNVFMVLRRVVLAFLIALGLTAILCSCGGNSSSDKTNETVLDKNNDKWNEMVWDKDDWG